MCGCTQLHGLMNLDQLTTWAVVQVLKAMHYSKCRLLHYMRDTVTQHMFTCVLSSALCEFKAPLGSIQRGHYLTSLSHWHQFEVSLNLKYVGKWLNPMLRRSISMLQWISSMFRWIAALFHWISSLIHWTNGLFHWIASRFHWSNSLYHWDRVQ